MPKKPSACIQDCFATLIDPRRPKATYPLINVVTLVICAVICDVDDFVAIAARGHVKQACHARYLSLPKSSGIPT